MHAPTIPLMLPLLLLIAVPDARTEPAPAPAPAPARKARISPPLLSAIVPANFSVDLNCIPSMAVVHINIKYKNGTHFGTGICSGSLVTKTCTITAAHCSQLFYEFSQDKGFIVTIDVIVGTRNAIHPTPGSQIFKNVTFFQHPDYTSTATEHIYDVTLLRHDPAVVTSIVNVVTLSPPVDTPYDGNCVVCGYGRDSYLNASQYNGDLRGVASEICEIGDIEFEFFSGFDSTQQYALTPNILLYGQADQGDSGGPCFKLVCECNCNKPRLVQIAITVLGIIFIVGNLDSGIISLGDTVNNIKLPSIESAFQRIDVAKIQAFFNANLSPGEKLTFYQPGSCQGFPPKNSYCAGLFNNQCNSFTPKC